jgi:hypothetical protein
VILKATEKISAEIVRSISEDTEDLCNFIDFVKVHAIAVKIAFRCDRAAAWHLLGTLLREFEKIGMYRRKYDDRVDEIATKIKDTSASSTVESRLKAILEEARNLKNEFEKQYAQTTARSSRKMKT